MKSITQNNQNDKKVLLRFVTSSKNIKGAIARDEIYEYLKLVEPFSSQLWMGSTASSSFCNIRNL